MSSSPSASSTAASIAAIMSNDNAFALPSSRCTISTPSRRSVVTAAVLMPENLRDRARGRRCAGVRPLLQRSDGADVDAGGRHLRPWPRRRCARRSGRSTPRARRRRRRPPTPSTRCSSVPTPPLAITGTSTASAIARVSSRSKPSRVPSRSIDVSRISPAPEPHGLAGPLDGVDARRRATAVEVDLPAVGRIGADGAWRRSHTRRTARRTRRRSRRSARAARPPRC